MQRNSTRLFLQLKSHKLEIEGSGLLGVFMVPVCLLVGVGLVWIVITAM